jgi:hypothetical protein
MHARLLKLSEEGTPYLSILYNLGLIAFTASTLGLLMGKVTDLFSHRSHTTDIVDESVNTESKK